MPTQEELLGYVRHYTDHDYPELNVYLIKDSNYVHITICKQENVSEQILIYINTFEDFVRCFNKRGFYPQIKLELINCFIEGFENEVEDSDDKKEPLLKNKKEPLFSYWSGLVSLRLVGDNIHDLQRLSGNPNLKELEILTSSNINLDDIHSLTSIERVRYNNKVFSSPAELARFRQIR